MAEQRIPIENPDFSTSLDDWHEDDTPHCFECNDTGYVLDKDGWPRDCSACGGASAA